ALDVEVLEHRLDHDVAALEILEPVGDVQVALGPGDVGVGQPALRHQSLQDLDDAGPCLGRAAGGGVEQDHLDAALPGPLRRHLRDPAPHRAGPHDADGEIGAVDVESHTPVPFVFT